jgi:uncharacterized membrane protein YiaA
MPEQPLNVSVDKNDITRTGRIVAGFLLVGFTLLPILFIIGLWPNQMPTGNSRGYYAGTLFHMTLLTDDKLIEKAVAGSGIHINTILFLLVALSGFMGSMVHLSTSFTNYIGAGRFNRNWTLWYCVKPFTAAGVAIIFYMVLNAGLLSGGTTINPYGIVILAALAGLFTDKATMKLEEVFTILFQPKDERPNRINEKNIKITGFDPQKLLLDKDNNIIIKGENFDQGKITVKINGEDVQNINIENEAISFSYKVAEKLAKEKKLVLSVFDGVRLLKTGEFELDGIVTAEGDQQGQAIVLSKDQPENAEAGQLQLQDEEDGEPIDVDEIIKG